MDWARAIERNSEALKGIVEALFAMLGLAGDATVARIPQPLHRAVLRVLRPAESAVRRLIVIAARGLVVKLRALASDAGGANREGRALTSLLSAVRSAQEFRGAAPAPRKVTRSIRHASISSGLIPRWRTCGQRAQPVAAPAPPPDDLVNAARLTRRLQALKLALEDLPRQARRLARWRVRREKAQNPKFKSPLRPGRPPGYRRKPVHEVDEVLIECHGLAWDALKPDTS